MMEMEIYAALNDHYTVVEKIHQGKKHLVVPVIMMREGVHNGSHGAIFHPINELGHFEAAWNGIPVSIQHPSVDGKHVSANSPDIIDATVVGKVFNTHVEGDRLKAEAWLDKERLKQISPAIADYLKKGQPIEVSLGMFTDDEAGEGTWNGETYTATARNHRPDHLALLPGGRGACSWKDGCGIRANEEEGGDSGVKVNAVGYKEIMDKLRALVSEVEGTNKYVRIEEVYTKDFVYSTEPGNLIGSPMNLFQQDYSVDKAGTVTLIGTAVPVQVKTDYIKLNMGKDKKMADENKGCCPEKVEMLIQDENSKFTETDREWLLTQSEEMIEKLQPVIVEKEVIKEVIKEVKVNKEVPVTNEQIIQVLTESFSDQAKFLALLPETLRDQMESGLRLHEEHRNKLIDHIVTNQATPVWTKEDLAKMDMNTLKRFADSIPGKTNYRLAGGQHVQVNTQTDEMLLPIGVK